METATVRLDPGVAGSGHPAEWLTLIWKCNEIHPGMFGRPVSHGDWWAGGYVEEYGMARLVLPDGKGRQDSEGAMMASKTDEGARVIKQACEALGIHYPGI